MDEAKIRPFFKYEKCLNIGNPKYRKCSKIGNVQITEFPRNRKLK